jgi:hypothetical protein
MKDPKLHIYGQSYFHEHAFIVGNTEALRALRDAIDDALETGTVVSGITAFTADGEGYEVKVYREEDKEYWDNASLPYTDRTIFSDRDDAIGPWDLFRKYKE